jgi:cholesterol transport system auxiliary component
VLLPLALAGCGSLFQTKAAPPTMYLLSMPKSTAPTAAALPVDLAVLKPRVRGGIDTDRIALLYPDRRLDYYANVRWSGPLDELMQELAVQEFHAVGAVRNISTDASVFASSYWLEIEVVDFQSEYASLDALPTVHVHLLARIGGSSERRVIARFETDARETAAENRLSAIVDAYNRAADKALGDIVAQSTEILKAR